MYAHRFASYLSFSLLAFAGLFAHDIPAPPPPPEVVQAYKEFHALGCFIDDTLHRSLVRFEAVSDNMTVENCLDICLEGDFALGGVEFGQECYCGNAILYNPQPDPDGTGCSMACTGSATEACGGSFSIEIYHNFDLNFTVGDAQLIQSYKDWNASGCFEDTAARLVPNRLPLSPETMTVEQCLDGCAAGNFTVGALQFGQECYCGNVTLPAGEPAEDAACNMPCTGNATEFCGAGNLNWIYFLPGATFGDD